MATPAKVKKISPTRRNRELLDDEVEPIPGSSRSKKLCIVCAETASSSITKDDNFSGMMQLYFCTLGVDVKPVDCNKCDICRKCFNKIEEYYETNDIIVFFENYFKSLRIDLMRKTMQGLAKLEEGGLQLTKINQNVRKKYANLADIEEPEEEQIRQTLNGYKMETYNIIDDSEDEEKKENQEGPRTGIKLTKVNGTDSNSKKVVSKISIRDKSSKGEFSDSSADDIEESNK